MHSTADGELEFTRSLPSINARILSIAWQPNDAGLFVGAVDGTIRHVDSITGHSAYRMTLESRNSLSPPTMVWCLKVRDITHAFVSTSKAGTHCIIFVWQVLNDGTVISGDSLGSIHFWDGTMGTLLQSFTVHEVITVGPLSLSLPSLQLLTRCLINRRTYWQLEPLRQVMFSLPLEWTPS